MTVHIDGAVIVLVFLLVVAIPVAFAAPRWWGKP